MDAVIAKPSLVHHILNIMVESSALLLCMWEAMGLNLKQKNS
jgi:hypothetical protein